MAKWNEGTIGDMKELAQRFGEEAASNLRVKIGAWADTIGKKKSKQFGIEQFTVVAEAEDHEVLNVVLQ